ncbi:L-threonylcarbamoyladenylate synthase [Oikeobacillus pervagus]|uniref:Threonylcarbamoyl-AMP synthase n=1 Tax=Oikeobacillus pervagus TaxID=1325931 RepID=A0AAJ1WJJ1_9BACI|nr:L-threonylcarbamoyladenylate synthase [Oikeobacillus pervagus]MDQ0214156.1 L-threonylcarbamoyladenylate synthase [Oikeobacillus pervagus]
MLTKHWVVDNPVDAKKSYPQIKEAATLLQKGEVVAFPTETVYGLGADALKDEAVAKIYHAKGRPSDNPLIVHIANQSQLNELVATIPEAAKKLMGAFWPGPLTIIFKKKANVLSEKVTAGLETVAIRMPNHPVALAVIAQAQLPIAAPSANQSGKPSPTTAQHVLDDLKGRIAGVVDGGETGVGVESTVVDCTAPIPVILRPGGITKEAIETIVGKVSLDPALKDKESQPKSPGMKYKHYAPDMPMYLLDGHIHWIQKVIQDEQAKGKKVGLLTTEERVPQYKADVIIPCGRREDLSSVAKSLYDVLRKFNETDVDIIFSEVFPKEGVGLAIMNRLEKAAAHQWMVEME